MLSCVRRRREGLAVLGLGKDTILGFEGGEVVGGGSSELG